MYLVIASRVGRSHAFDCLLDDLQQRVIEHAAPVVRIDTGHVLVALEIGPHLRRIDEATGAEHAFSTDLPYFA